jgi:hypothetical protein
MVSSFLLVRNIRLVESSTSDPENSPEVKLSLQLN